METTDGVINGVIGINIGDKDSISALQVSEVVMSAVQLGYDNSIHIDKWKSMLDTGATVTLIPTVYAALLGLQIMPHTDGRRVGTADQEGTLEIQGWVDLSGYVGRAAVCSAVKFIIVASCQLQACGLGMDLQPNTTICELYTDTGSFALLDQCTTTHLYYIDLRLLLNQPLCLYVPNFEGCQPYQHYHVLSTTTSSDSRRKPSTSLSF